MQQFPSLMNLPGMAQSDLPKFTTPGRILMSVIAIGLIYYMLRLYVL